jgi:hypothetical protein
MRRIILAAVLVALAVGACQPSGTTASNDESPRWYRGNLHTHSLWSDGDDFPESIVGWYKGHGYDFIALSDHNVLAVGDKWIDVIQGTPRFEAYQKYLAEYGDAWVDSEASGETLRVRLKTLEEYRTLFEDPGRFLIISSEEISDHFEDKPIHVNATNVAELIDPQGGGSVQEVLQNNIDAVLEQRERTGRPMFPHINHPNFMWALTAEDLIAVEGERFFEVYNGHPLVHNLGDDQRPGMDRLWDIVLTERLARGGEILYGLATDDAHNYHETRPNLANPGRGWVMVRASALTPEALIEALEAGDFYAATGVELEDVSRQDQTLTVQIRPKEGVTYRTLFIGTRRGYTPPQEIAGGTDQAAVTRLYSDEIGEVLAEVEGTSPSYTFTGDELYVRAKIVSSRLKDNEPDGEYETAWTQPVVP